MYLSNDRLHQLEIHHPLFTSISYSSPVKRKKYVICEKNTMKTIINIDKFTQIFSKKYIHKLWLKTFLHKNHFEKIRKKVITMTERARGRCISTTVYFSVCFFFQCSV